MTRILFLVNGLGLGNSTRCQAVIARLQAAGAEIAVATSDNGLWFFQDQPGLQSLTAIPSLRYGARQGRISVAATLGRIPEMWATVQEAEESIGRVIKQFRPQVVVSDSVYALRPVRRAGIPLAAINNADMVARAMAGLDGRPPGVLPQFLAVELADYLFHHWLPDLVISPRLDPSDTYGTHRLRPVGPIVRDGFVAQDRPADRPRHVVIMLSGSVFGSPVTLHRPYPELVIDIIGRPGGPGDRPGLIHHGKLRDSRPLVRRADLLVVNGGCSAVSEALMLRKPVVVIPVPRHAEQWVNARIVRQLGLGFEAAEEDLEPAMQKALAQIDDMRAAYDRLPAFADGAAQAAGLILGLARR